MTINSPIRLLFLIVLLVPVVMTEPKILLVLGIYIWYSKGLRFNQN